MSDVKERIEAAKKRRTEIWPCPVLGDVMLQSRLQSEMRAIRETALTKTGEYDSKKARKVPGLLISSVVLDVNGAAFITPEDFDAFDSGVASALYAKVREFTNWDADPEWKAVEDAAKNSGDVP